MQVIKRHPLNFSGTGTDISAGNWAIFAIYRGKATC
jgi:hypothetical protein